VLPRHATHPEGRIIEHTNSVNVSQRSHTGYMHVWYW
jgi:hypothetical protein